MKNSLFKAILRSDVVVSEESATTGGHACLSFLPGACFLGSVASKLYSRLNGKSFDVFHSGAVRFGNAYPADEEGMPTFPIPLSWHVPKGEKAYDGSKLLQDKIFNLSRLSSETEGNWKDNAVQPKQIREGFFTEEGTFVNPSTCYHLKTAIERSAGGRAAESQLFGYESLDAGGIWYFSVDFDDNVSHDIQVLVENSLTKSPIRVGRSRSAEYGLVEVQKIDGSALSYNAVEGNPALFYCLSDAALRDPETGGPTLIPVASHFCLDGTAKLMPEKSFIRTRTYAPFNGRRRANDLERQVICKGSVIAFQVGEMTSKDLEEIQKKLSRGVGVYRHDGLGKVLLNPRFLSSEKFSPAVPPAGLKRELEIVPQPSNTLLEWMDSKIKERKSEQKAIQLVGMWVESVAPEIIKGKKDAPGKSQWSQLRDIAVRCGTLEEVREKLFTSEKALCNAGVSKSKWAAEFLCLRENGKKERMTFKGFLENVVLAQCAADPALTRKVLYLLGNRMPQKLNQRGG